MATTSDDLQIFSAAHAAARERDAVHVLPLFVGDPARPIAWRNGKAIALGQFKMHAATLAAGLPANGAMINLCEDRYHFLVAYAAALGVGHSVQLPFSRSADVVSDLERSCNGAYRCADDAVARAIGQSQVRWSGRERIERDQLVMVGYTSGSTGVPKRNPKTWGMVHGSNAQNVAAIRMTLREAGYKSAASIVATVPPQHMYGMETSVLLPMIGGFGVHSARPLFPADIAQALSELPEPRVLVSTPVHLRAMIESSTAFPKVAVVVSATAPLDATLARAVEQRLGTRLLEMFGSTETCVIATRHTARDRQWHLYPGVHLSPLEHGTHVQAPWFNEPVMLQDLVEMTGPGTFVVRGRNTDMIEVAGKRASLGDLTRRLMAIAGVKDAAVFQPDAREGSVARVAALVVAPGMSPRDILNELAKGVDAAFLPRPLRLVESLPRNELGKLPRDRLLQALQER